MPTDDAEDEGPKLVPVRLADGTVVRQPLPPIDQIIIPSTKTKSALIRWLWVMGYPIKEIYSFLGVKYQMVRNIVTTIPKRSTREDSPPLEVMWRPEPEEFDPIGLAMDMELEESIKAERKQRFKDAYHARNGPEEPEE